ncbi:hypothetical protein BZA70DRAFT_274113 [Myxozyma melibiosi]|uniref:U1-type domain-containing protein n=1 Tax=Myxozyma melibiosi TaxID=54550 RepID=A0ABR1FFE4_9ASCO
MSKYWCKPCKTFVLDTKLGKSQHEASVRHKSSMDRMIRDLNRTKVQAQRSDRDAKRILEQIEKAVGGEIGTSAPSSAPVAATKTITTTAAKPTSSTTPSQKVPMISSKSKVLPSFIQKKPTSTKQKSSVLGMLPDGLPPSSSVGGIQPKSGGSRIAKGGAGGSKGFSNGSVKRS